MNTPSVHPVYLAMNRPLTIGGADRRLFLVAVVIGAATFTLFGGAFTGMLMFAALYAAARWVTQTDPQLLRIVLSGAGAHARYDAGILAYLRVRREGERR